MLKKIGLLAMAGMCWSSVASAVPNNEEFSKCLKTNATDAGLTKCFEQETTVVKQEIRKTEDTLRPITTTENGNINILYNYMSRYIRSYCAYYVQAHKGDGYSAAYHEAKCNLTRYMHYYRELQGLYNVSMNDMEE